MMAKNANPEAKIQIQICKYLRAVMPGGMVQQARNEHGKAGMAGMMNAVRNKAMGSVTGFPDLVVFPGNGAAFMLEVKAPKGRVSDSQKECHTRLAEIGYQVAIVRSVDDVRDFLNANSIPHKEVAY